MNECPIVPAFVVDYLRRLREGPIWEIIVPAVLPGISFRGPA